MSTTPRIRKYRDSSMFVVEPCPRCGERFHVHCLGFHESRSAGRFLWWKWDAEPARYRMVCAQCWARYTIVAELPEADPKPAAAAQQSGNGNEKGADRSAPEAG